MSELDSTDRALVVTACHEAGHAAAAAALGLRFDRVTIQRRGEAAGWLEGVPYPSPTTLDAAAVEDYLVYLYAGAAAVRALMGPGVLTGGSEDYRQAEHWAAQIAREPLAYRAVLARARSRAAALVRAHRAGIEALRTALLMRADLSGEEARALLLQNV
jgi:ATP-dependent Zn protease